MPEFHEDPQWKALHPVVGHALRVAELPPDGIARFGVEPKLTSQASHRVGLWVTRFGRRLVDASHLEAYDAGLTACEVLFAPPDPATASESRRAVQQLGLQRKAPGCRGLPTALAGLLMAATYSVQQVLVAMASRVTKALPPEEVRPFVLALQEQVLREECQAAVDAYLRPPVRVHALVWRGTRGSGAAGHFLFATADGYGLVTKLKRRWNALSGDRDEVLATVPEPFFEAATAALFAYEASRSRS